MIISELINKLETIKQEEGDLPCCIIFYEDDQHGKYNVEEIRLQNNLGYKEVILDIVN